jgi:hypothetical protein
MVSVSVSSSENKPGLERCTDAPLACVELYNRSRTTENLGQVFYFPHFFFTSVYLLSRIDNCLVPILVERKHHLSLAPSLARTTEDLLMIYS